MGRWSCALIALTGCNSILGIGDPGVAPPDGPAFSCPIEGTDLCAYEAPYGPIRITTDTTIDTTSDCNVVLIAPGGGSVCVLYGTTIDVIAKLRGTGNRPLVLAATGAITISGKVDVSSNQTAGIGAASGVNDACATFMNINGYGGGAGGSFHGSAGNGGAGMRSASNTGVIAQAATTAAPTNLVGGCNAVGVENGLGGQGAGGGVVELASGTSIEIGATGIVSANGQGGTRAGGGAGGMIELSAPSITIHGVVVANGGGGSQGLASGDGFTAAKGADGADSATPALGGFGGTQASGGAGGAGSTINGTKGSDATVVNYQGGYGGGGAGFIVIDTPPSDTSGGVISPTPTSS